QLESEGVLVADGDGPTPRQSAQGERQAARADVQDRHATRLVLGFRRGPAEPAGLVRGPGVGRLPDVHGFEVRALRVRVADALHDGQLSFIPQFPQALHARVETDVVVEADDG